MRESPLGRESAGAQSRRARGAPEHPLERTPTLERLLAATRAALVRQVLAYGVGTVLGAATLWLVFAFLADWGLRVPHAIRVLHGLCLLAVVALFSWRDLLRPLRSLPDREGLSLLFERAHPELRELLISAVQFQRVGTTHPGDRELIEVVVSGAEARAASLTPRAVVDPEAPRARLLLGLGGILCLGALAVLNPLHARTFLERMLGGSAAWPQRTHLVLELPSLEPEAVVERTRERLRLRLARGSDIALMVTAEGEAPSEVIVHFEGGRDLVLNPSGANVYRTLLQSCQDDLAFHVTGGDDQDGLPRVEVEVLEPPDVEGLALVVQPPAYSGLALATFFNQDVEVLKGSIVTVHVLSAPLAARGQARLLPEDTTVALEPAPFPRAPGEENEPELHGLAFTCTAEKTLGFRIELVDESGLTNPEPGLYRIRVLEDRAPELAVLSPSRGDIETVRGGALALRVRAEDDFALASLGWRLRPSDAASEEAPPLLSAELALQRLGEGAGAQRSKATRDVALGSARLEVDSLGTGGAPVAVDSRFELEFFARDQRAPAPNEGRSASVRVRVVTPEELLRRLQDRLAETRIDALRLSDEQRAKRARIEELLDALDGDDPLETGESLALSSALAGQRRVLADAQALARALAGAAEDVLYARLDDKAGGLLEFYDARVARALDARFQAEPWRELAREIAAGKLPGDGFAATLVKLVALALAISEDHAALAVAALDAAEEATTRTAVGAGLQQAAEHAARVEKELEVLLAELAEWDNFQNVLTLARDILNRQKALRDRTQQFATEK
jgi:hypothetical protein